MELLSRNAVIVQFCKQNIRILLLCAVQGLGVQKHHSLHSHIWRPLLDPKDSVQSQANSSEAWGSLQFSLHSSTKISGSGH